jgi:enterochelin esterase family protein
MQASKGDTVRQLGIAILLFLGVCFAQESGDFYSASTNVWGAEYPKVDSAGRVQLRAKAPEATKVRVLRTPIPDIQLGGQLGADLLLALVH